MSATEWTALVVAAIGAVGAIVLQGLQMYFSYKRDSVMKATTQAVERKLDHNTQLTSVVKTKVDENTTLTEEVKTSADKASQHVEGCDERMKVLNAKLATHDSRINSLEGKVNDIQKTVELLGKNIDSTRHEMRNDLQTLMNKLDLLMVIGKSNSVTTKQTAT